MRKPMKALLGAVGVLGRIMLCAVFLAAALGYTVPDIHHVADTIGPKAAVAPTWALVGSVVLLVAGSFSLVVGYKARLGAMALLVFLGLVTYYCHGFTLWTLLSAQARQEHIIYLVTNVSMMGAMLVIIANGAGQMSLDGKR